MKTPELKPCPFCGVQLELTKYEGWKHPDGKCFLASADTEYGNIWVAPDEIDGWNRRVTDG